MAQDLTINEYPLISVKCDGLTIQVPSRGFRSYDFLKKKKIIDECYDDDFIHKYHIMSRCRGFRRMKCNRLKKLKKKSEILENNIKKI